MARPASEWAITIVEARGLRAADIIRSDPYCLLYWSSGDSAHTHTEHFTLCPKFNERFVTYEPQSCFVVKLFGS